MGQEIAMRPTRASFEPWLNDCLRRRSPELEESLLAAINAFDAVECDGGKIEEHLRPIVDAASSSRRPLYENAVEFMAKLSSKHELVRTEIEKMSNDGQSQVRFNAILCLGKTTPVDFSLRQIKKGLRDRSSRVRWKAADWAGRLRLYQLVTELEQAFSTEKNEKARSTIKFELQLLRDGYILEPAGSDRFNVTTFLQAGGIVSRSVSRSELELQGLNAVVAAMSK